MIDNQITTDTLIFSSTAFVTLGLIFLTSLYYLCRRFNALHFIFFLLLPLLFTPMLVKNADMSWFAWVKLYSLMVPLVLIGLCKATSLGDKGYAMSLMWCIIAINIAEAGLKDLQNQNYLNALSALLLLLALPSSKTILVEKTKGSDFVWRVDLIWILAYTLWNWCFVYGNYIQHAIYHIAILSRWREIDCSNSRRLLVFLRF